MEPRKAGLMRAVQNAFDRLDDRLWLPGFLASAAEPVFRISLSLIFIVGGLGHFVRVEEMLDRIEQSPWHDQVLLFGDPKILLWLSGGVFILFGALLAIGILKRFSALMMFVTLVPITVSIHIAPGHVGPLLKNVAILGALLLVYAKGERRL